MIKGIYNAAAGMRPQSLKMDVVANNLANINSTGFKKENIFINILAGSGTASAKTAADRTQDDVKQYTDFSEGTLAQTTNRLDLAVQGRGFFTVETPNGIRYTRDGNFTLNADGTVVTMQGYPVLGTGGRIQLPDLQRLTASDLIINEGGEITVDRRTIGRLRIADFENLKNLRKDGHSLFEATDPEKGVAPDGKETIIRQGFLEESNVDGITEMIQLIEMTRSFESEQRSIQAQDGTLDKAMDVGRV